MDSIDKLDIDRVGNTEQKEEALDKAGVTYKLLAEKIMLLLNAKKSVETIKDGVITVEMVDDLDKIAKGIELGGKALMMLKDFDKVGSVTNNFTFASMVKVAMTEVLPTQTHNRVEEIPVIHVETCVDKVADAD